ncbi:hypothetical protein D5086_019628 [Populus alba]|uniref:Uncharacterized protein n=1 Tax=Populus alba TaxID=43335 RepID=A0ACC4BJ84_POPAL
MKDSLQLSSTDCRVTTLNRAQWMPLPATAVKDMVAGTELNLYAIDQLSISEVALVKAPGLNNLVHRCNSGPYGGGSTGQHPLLLSL